MLSVYISLVIIIEDCELINRTSKKNALQAYSLSEHHHHYYYYCTVLTGYS